MILDEKRQKHLNYIHKSGMRIRMQVGKWVQKQKAKMTLEQARSMHADASELFFGTCRQPLAPWLVRVWHVPLLPAQAQRRTRTRLPNKSLALIHHQ